MGILKAGRPTKRTHEHVEEQLKMLEGEKRLNVKMSESDYDKLRRVCFEKRISISSYVREIIMQSIKNSVSK